MQNSAIVNQFHQALDELLTVAKREAELLHQHRSTLSIDYCPSHSEIIPILRSCSLIAQSFGAFLTTLRQVLEDTSLMQVAIRDTTKKLPDVTLLVSYLLSPYQVVNNLNSNRVKATLYASVLWQETSELVSWYAYLGASGTASTSLVSKLNWFLDPHSQLKYFTWDEYCSIFPPMLTTANIRGLFHIARRAEFLSRASDEQIKQASLEWWSQQVDSVSFGSSEEYTWLYLIKACPDLAHPNAQKLLQEIATHSELSDEVKKQARLAVGR